MSDENGPSCPICLREGLPMGSGPCGHPLCRQCMERILLSSRRGPPSSTDDRHPDPEASAPTRGRCPICRSAVSLFEVKSAPVSESGEGGGALLYEKDHDVDRSPLAGCVFAMEGEVGFASYHFPKATDAGGGRGDVRAVEARGRNNSQDSRGRNLPFVMYGSPLAEESGWALDDGTALPKRKYFEEGCHYHAKSRTFHGTLDWSKEKEGGTWDGASKWEVIMQFSSDLRYVCAGAVIKRRDLPEYPLDGRWRVRWTRPKPDGSGDLVESDETAVVEVVAGQFELFEWEYTIDWRTDPKRASFRWPRTTEDEGDGDVGRRHLQWAVSGVDLVGNPEGPPVGAAIVWATDHPGYPRITWVRESMGGAPPAKVARFGPRDHFYRRWTGDVADQSSLPQYRPGSIWGNVFVQAMKVGLASYHFVPEHGEGEGGAYISYEHPLCSLWPPLDDGSPVPSRVPFRDVRWDGQMRTFGGTIDWQGRYGTTWQGSSSWRYEMVFDSEYMCIVSGQVFNKVDGGGETEWSTFGENLIYLNAAVVDKLLDMLHPESSSENGEFSDGGGSRSSLRGVAAERDGLRPDNENMTLNGGNDDGITPDIEESINSQDQNDGANSSSMGGEESLHASDERGEGGEDEAGGGQERHPAQEDFLQVSSELRRRLVGEGASQLTVAVMSRLLRTVQRGPENNPMDFNL